MEHFECDGSYAETMFISVEEIDSFTKDQLISFAFSYYANGYE